MTRLNVQDGYFTHPSTYEPLTSIQAVIVDRGTLSRNYYEDDKLLCWSFDADFPDDEVPSTTQQSTRCIDCVRNIKQGGYRRGTACKFFTVIKLVIPYEPEVYELRIGALSLFSRDTNRFNLNKYIDYLQSNNEEVENVLTEIYFGEKSGISKMYFKPSRPLAEDELVEVQQLVEDAAIPRNPFETMKEENFMSNDKYIIKDVKALYPKLDQPYRFDKKAGPKGKSVPCEATADGAIYELDFVMTKAQAKELYQPMAAAYEKARKDSWPEKLELPFTKDDDGNFVGSARIKAAYDKKPIKPPPQYDSQNAELPEGFLLTTGSTVCIAVEFFPYDMNGHSVSLRLRGIQVIDYIPYQAPSPFEKTDGFSASDAPSPFEKVEEKESSDNMFEDATPKKETSSDPFDGDDDEVTEPTKRPKKKEKPPKDDDDDLSNIIDEWGSDDS